MRTFAVLEALIARKTIARTPTQNSPNTPETSIGRGVQVGPLTLKNLCLELGVFVLLRSPADFAGR